MTKFGKKKPIQFTPEEQADYNKLVANIRKEIDDAYVKGVDFNREHFLNCYSCECFEGMSKKGARGVCGAEQKVCHVDQFSQPRKQGGPNK